MYQELLTILRKEVSPALGCTGPVAVAFAGAAARAAVGGTPKKIKLILDRDTYKNTMRVCTPGSSYMGVVYPTILGAFYGDPSLGMEVLDTVKDYDPVFVEGFKDNCFTTEIFWDYKGMGVYAEAYVETEHGVGHVIVAKSHVHIVLLEANGTVLQKEESFSLEDYAFEQNDTIRVYGLRDFFHFADTVPYEDIAFLKEAVKYNLALAEEGLRLKSGGGFGLGFSKLDGNEMYLKAKMYAAAASDARMDGVNLPAMACATSGNVGITASVPLVMVQRAYGQSEEALVRAIALSYLLTIDVKSHIGRLSAMCACAIAAGIGIAGGSSYLISHDPDKAEKAIQSLVGSLGGVLCDGAKYGCALKLSNAAGAAIEAALLAAQEISIPAKDGLVRDTADETIAMLGRIARDGMYHTDEILCRLLVEQESASVKDK